MNEKLVEDYLRKSGMDRNQAQALARLFEQMATKADLQQEIGALRLEMRAGLAELEARMTWRIITAMVFLGAFLTIIDLFVD